MPVVFPCVLGKPQCHVEMAEVYQKSPATSFKPECELEGMFTFPWKKLVLTTLLLGTSIHYLQMYGLLLMRLNLY